MKEFVNMDFNGTQWWVEYKENEEYFINYFDTEDQAKNFYHSIV